MLYLIFADGALHGSETDFDKAIEAADAAAEHSGDTAQILRLDNARWCGVNDKGAYTESSSSDFAHRPAPAEEPAPAEPEEEPAPARQLQRHPHAPKRGK